MASWKKVIVSGSKADLLQVTASTISVTGAGGLATKKLLVSGSGMISASHLMLFNPLSASYGGTGLTGSGDAGQMEVML